MMKDVSENVELFDGDDDSPDSFCPPEELEELLEELLSVAEIPFVANDGVADKSAEVTNVYGPDLQISCPAALMAEILHSYEGLLGKLSIYRVSVVPFTGKFVGSQSTGPIEMI
jgi:hypothetical protein